MDPSNMKDVRQIPVSAERIRELFPNASFAGNLPDRFSSVTDDSRTVTENGIFVAVIGYETDGHLFIEKALAGGAELVVAQKDHCGKNPDFLSCLEERGLMLVENTRLAASVLADELYGHPSSKLDVHGVTGTKGKTTTVNLLAGILEAAGRKPAVMGTLGVTFGDNFWPSALTTPGPIEFQKRLRFLADAGATDVACEVSAHAGALSRTASVRFRSVTYMNLSRDHGDHFSEDEYLDAKLAIARDAVRVNPEVKGIGNALDPHTEKFLEPVPEQNRFRFAALEEQVETEIEIDLVVTVTEKTPTNLGLNLSCKDWERDLKLPLIGLFNAQNSAAAASIAITAGIGPDAIVAGLEHAKPVSGRLEKIDHGQDFLVVVDYAHAPQPAQEALRCLREITRGKLIGVMGAGGSRDRGKRPMIGEVLARECDIAVVTSDNPRREEPLDIINDILVGVQKAKNPETELLVEVDRRKAIGMALEKALPGDTVAILGKGHETYQIFATETIHFDDREVVSEWLTDHGYGGTE